MPLRNKLGVLVTKIVLTVMLIFFIAPLTYAHHLWITEADDNFVLMRGLIPDQIHPYNPDAIKKITAYVKDKNNEALKEIDVNRINEKERVIFKTSEAPAVVEVTCEWGERVNTPDGKKLVSKAEALQKGIKVLSSFYSTQYLKACFDLSKGNLGQIGLKFEIVPMLDLNSVKIGTKMPIKVVFDGKPLADCKVKVGQHKDKLKTDSKGIVNIDIKANGIQNIYAIYEVPISGRSDIDYWQYMTFLTFKIP